MTFWDAASSLTGLSLLFLGLALLVAFAFEFINGFHDTANAVTTVIYTRSLPPTPAVFYSGFMNFLGVLLGGTSVAFGIVNLLPVDLLVAARSGAALVMVMSLLLAGVIWNLSTWFIGLPVSSTHTLVGSIMGVGIANGLWNSQGLSGVDWSQVEKVGLALILSPLLGFLLSFILLTIIKFLIPVQQLYKPPEGDDRPPHWIRAILIVTCGAVSYHHGSNDGQKGMGLILLVLIGFLPVHYALTVEDPRMAPTVLEGLQEIRTLYAENSLPLPHELERCMNHVERELAGKESFQDLPQDKDSRWHVRGHILCVKNEIQRSIKKKELPQNMSVQLKNILAEKVTPAVEYVPLWVVVCVAIALGVGTTVGYKRIVVTVAEKIGKSHLTYAQGAAAETVAALTIGFATKLGLSVSTTQVLSSGIAGTMVANKSGIQGSTIQKILLAWLMTLPATMLLAGVLFSIGRLIIG